MRQAREEALSALPTCLCCAVFFLHDRNQPALFMTAISCPSLLVANQRPFFLVAPVAVAASGLLLLLLRAAPRCESVGVEDAPRSAATLLLVLLVLLLRLLLLRLLLVHQLRAAEFHQLHQLRAAAAVAAIAAAAA